MARRDILLGDLLAPFLLNWSELCENIQPLISLPYKLIDFDISLRSSYQVLKQNDMISGLFLLKGTRTLLMFGRCDPGEEADLDMPGVDQGQGLQQQ